MAFSLQAPSSRACGLAQRPFTATVHSQSSDTRQARGTALHGHAHLREERGGQLQLQALLLPQVPLQLVAQLERRQVLPRRQRRVVQLRQARLRGAEAWSAADVTLMYEALHIRHRQMLPKLNS